MAALLPEIATTKLPKGSNAAIARAAALYDISPSQYVRACVWNQLRADGLSTRALDTVSPRLAQLAKAHEGAEV
ncbi:hypothetical protein [Methylobacterium oxalidis]|uniref:Uncharacterized protein n=1 Tax=Methylobacterium oxalidis TaxID=944322 RepID=A0A512IX41_9HYPH|nr:hypothetical protein [Methylobacterium oxalidis]GEP02287.1 hypothetical protein MOX02_03250 [Methylobacterium oxalidis]GJE32277.1 hypothetical protein LDDCCGHA_2463 [Methylobacterium oxalidis]GLS62232.1 hypothetical protein GCM10007888_06130 [Methylobacterium oxalidis]